MNIVHKSVVLGVAGALILQLAVITSAQEIGPSGEQVPETSALQPLRLGLQRARRVKASSPRPFHPGGAVTKPGKAGGLGDPAFGGQRHRLYRLSKSDTVDVSFTFTPEFNQSVTVQPDGFVSLKGAGTFFAEGLTVEALQPAMVDLY